MDLHFVHDNHSKSAHGVLRGLCYQLKNFQGKRVRVVHGRVFGEVVDLRKSLPTLGQSVGTYLYANTHQHLWVGLVLRMVLRC